MKSQTAWLIVTIILLVLLAPVAVPSILAPESMYAKISMYGGIAMLMAAAAFSGMMAYYAGKHHTIWPSPYDLISGSVLAPREEVTRSD